MIPYKFPLSFLLLSFLSFGSHAPAEEFLGDTPQEADSPYREDSEGIEAAEESEGNFNKPQPKPQRVLPESADDIDEPASYDSSLFSETGEARFSARKIPVVGGIESDRGLFLGVGFPMNSLLSYEVSLSFDQKQIDDLRREFYGPEFDLSCRFANRTVLVPYASVGVGYRKWRIKEADEIRDESESLTSKALVGLHLKLTKNFGLRLHRKVLKYLTDAPADLKLSGNSHVFYTSVGFILTI
jgi:hypothetical protein